MNDLSTIHNDCLARSTFILDRLTDNFISIDLKNLMKYTIAIDPATIFPRQNMIKVGNRSNPQYAADAASTLPMNIVSTPNQICRDIDA
jgi:hypothetical protein